MLIAKEDLTGAGPAGYDYHQHVHDHSGKTTCDKEHAHMYPGVTGTPQPVAGSHTHLLRGVTTYDLGHTHGYYAQTGTAVELPGGLHTHYVAFQTNEVNGHRHNIMGYVVPSK